MVAFRFIHCSDLHIDSPFSGIATLQPELAKKLRASTQQAFDNIVQLAIREQVDAVIVAGDIYDSDDKSLQAQLKFRGALETLATAAIPAFLVHGNHDPLDSWSASLRWPGNVTVFSGDTVESVAVKKNGRVLAHIYGISFPVRDVRENLALKFERKPHEGFAIGVLHANVGGNPNHDSYAPCSVDDLASVDMDYWALGHIHAREILRPQNPAIVYCGNTQARHFKETGEKGCCLVTLNDKGAPKIQFVATEAVRYHDESIDLTDAVTMDDVLDTLRAKCEDLAGAGRDCVVRLTLSGRSEVHPELQRSGTVEDLMKELQEDYGNRKPWVWVELELATQGAYDVDALRQGQDFIADLIGLYDEIEKGEHRQEIMDVLSPLFDNRQYRDILGEVSPSDFDPLLRRARNLTLDRLVDQD